MRRLSVCLLASVLALVSCKDKTTDADCGCSARNYTALENVRVSYAHGQINTFADDNRLVNSYSLCTPLDTLAETPDQLVPNYLMSGEVRMPCFEATPNSTPPPPLIKVTGIRKLQ